MTFIQGQPVCLLWPGSAGDMAKCSHLERPKMPVELPGEDWSDDPLLHQPGMRERQSQPVPDSLKIMNQSLKITTEV